MIEVGLHEHVHPLLDPRPCDQIDPRDVVAHGSQVGGDEAVGAPDVEDATTAPAGHPPHELAVARVLVGLVLVALAGDGEAVVPEAHPLQAVPEHVGDDGPRVGDAVDVADLVAVVGGDRHLDDPGSVVVQLQEHLGVEVEAVRVLLEGDAGQRGHREGPVAGVPLGEVQAAHGVLEAGEDAVADVLVERHPTVPGGAGHHHARAHHHISLVRLQRGHDVRQQLRRVLAVAVQHDDEVEALLDRPAIPELLVAAVAQVAGLTDHRDRQARLLPLHLDAHGVGVVSRVVVADEHGGDATAEGRVDPRQHRSQRGRRVVGDHEDPDAQGPSHSVMLRQHHLPT